MRRWLWLAVIFAGVILFVHYCVRFVPADHPLVPTEHSVAPQPGKTTDGRLTVPVAGVRREDLVDTFTQSRGEGRAHDAIDILAARGTPVLAAAPGTVEKLFLSKLGGNTIYVRSRDRRWLYYYAHLDAYAPGLAEGQHVRQGQVIARVGHTGNASAEGPHLHFAINQMSPGQKWWEGEPINPYPLLAGKKVSG